MTDEGLDSARPEPRQVFISYSREDLNRVGPIVHALANDGINVWWDDHIEGGQAFARAIESALASAEVVVVVWSHTSIGSDWVRDEAAVGRDRGRLVPVRIDPVTPPLGFRQYQVVDLCGWSGDPEAKAFRRFRASLTRGPTASETPADSVVAAVGSRYPSRRQLWTAVAGAAGAGAVTFAGWRLMQPSAPPHSIAVLPFANLSGDRAQDLVGDGLAEEVRSSLASLQALQVISRTSSEIFRGAKADAGSIAAKLGVAFLLEGVLQKSGDTLRIGARLIRGRDGFEQWTQTFDRPADNLLTLERDIADRVAAELKVRLLGPDAVLPGGTRSNPAYQAYLKARQLYDTGGDEQSLRQAAGLYEQALASDPEYADAMAGLARTLIAIADQFVSGAARESLFGQGLSAAEKAVRLAPNSAETQAALGFARMGRLDIKGARGPYERAGVLGAGDANRLVGFGGYEARIGRFEQALPALRRAVLLDPLNPNAHLTLGDALFLARRPTEAVEPLRRALGLNPNMIYTHSRLGDCQLAAGDAEAALSEYGAEPALLYRQTGLAIALERLNRLDKANAAFAELIAKMGDNGLYQQAQVQAQWAQTDRCLHALERGFALKDSGLTRMKVDPMLDNARNDVRFGRLLTALGFT